MNTFATTVDHLDHLRDHAAMLKRHLPWNCLAEADTRALLVYFQAERRYLEVFCKEAVMTIIPGLEELQATKRAEPLTLARNRAPDKRAIRELGKALKDLDDFCASHVQPLIVRLDRGLTMMEALPLTQDADDLHRKYVSAWMTLRKEVKAQLPLAWRVLIAARELFEGLPDAQQQEAIGIWGPLRGKGTDYGPLLRRSWPAEALEDLDRRARHQGVIDLDRPFPNEKYERRHK